MNDKLNILFLMTDQLRMDCTGFVPGSVVDTPNIDRIAEGVGFTNCQSVNPLCMPCRTALITGKYPRQVGSLSMSGDLDWRHPTFMQALQQAGYWTAGIGKFHYLQTWKWGAGKGEGVDLVKLKPKMQELGYDRVWESSGKQLAHKNYCDWCEQLASKGILDEARDWIGSRGTNGFTPEQEQLEKDGFAWPFDEEDHVDVATGNQILRAIEDSPDGKPFYILGSFCSPHKPFDPPQRYLDQVPLEKVDDFLPGEAGELSQELKETLWRLRRAYKATIRLIDDQIGRIFDALERKGLLENTVILFSSDHGELMGDHFRVQKSIYWKESLNVPTAIRHPRHLRGALCDAPLEITDLTATILDVAGLDPNSALSRDWPAYNDRVPCRSALPLVEDGVETIRDYAFSECGDLWQCIVSQDYKYVKILDNEDPDAPNEKLFDLKADPGEQCNLADQSEMQDIVAWHRRRLQFVLEKYPPAQTSWAPLC